MAMRPLRPRQEPASLVTRVSLFALSPVFLCVRLAGALLAGAASLASSMLQLPLRLAVRTLQLADALLGDLLALLTQQPAPRAQLRELAGVADALAQTKQSQQRQIALLQAELDSLKAEKSKTQRRNIEMAAKLQVLQLRLRQAEAASAGGASLAASEARASIDAASLGGAGSLAPSCAGAPPNSLAGADDGLGGSAFASTPGSMAGLGPAAGGFAAYATPGALRGSELPAYVPARGWYLHACVALAALAVRWWLLHQTDPLERKCMLVIIWPAAWVYGGLVTRVIPGSYTLRAALACTCWALLGYVAREMVAFSVQEPASHAAAASVPAAPAYAASWVSRP